MRVREIRFLSLIGINLFLILGSISAQLSNVNDVFGGWRRVDTGAVRAKIRAGDLVTHEAQWYRPEH